MRTFEEEDKLTIDVLKCQSWIELKTLITREAPFFSYSRFDVVEHSEEKLLKKMESIRAGAFPNLITRANGLRAKVCELVLCKNYNDPWE